MSRIRGIVLAGTYHWSGSAFEDLLPRPLVPVAQAPLVSYALRWLRDGGIARATLCANSASRAMRSYLGGGSRLTMSLEYHEDWTPRGAAGCVRDAATRSDADTLVVTDGTAIPAVNIGLLLDDHRTAGAAATIVVHHDRQARSGERPLNPGGIYVFDRRVLDYIPETGFQDIKENLIQKLYRAGERVVTHAGLGVCPRVLNAETYLAVNHWVIEQIAGDPSPLEHWGTYVENGETLAHPTAWVAPGARLVGPVLLGPSVKIGAGATIVGPTSLAADTQVGEGALVSRSVTWNRCRIGAGAVVDGCVLADDAEAPPHTRLFHSFRAREEARHLGLRERLGDDEAPAGRRASDTVPGLALP